MGEELEALRAEVDEQRSALRKVEDELRAAILEKRQLEPSGLFARFRGSPDPTRLEEVRTTVQVLEVELLDRRRRLNTAREAMELAERRAEREAMVPAWITDEETAADVLVGHTELARVLVELHAIAGAASRSRAAQRTHRTSRYGPIVDRNWAEHKASATEAATGEWEALLDQAERHADRVGLPLVLPRRYPSPARRAGEPQPTDSVAITRRSAVVTGNQDFGVALETAQARIQQLQQQSIFVTGALRDRFPGAHGLANRRMPPPPTAPSDEPTPAHAPTPPGQPPPLPTPAMAPSTPADPDAARLIQAWSALRDTLSEIQRVPGGKTMQLLDPVGRWQAQARELADDALASEHDLVPPLNQGMALNDFVAHLLEVWPDLDARFEAWRNR